MVRTREVLTERQLFPVKHGDAHDAASELQRRLDRIVQPAPDLGFDDQAVDDDFDLMLAVFVEPDRLGELVEGPVNPNPRKALSPQIVEELAVFAFAAADDRPEDE